MKSGVCVPPLHLVRQITAILYISTKSNPLLGSPLVPVIFKMSKQSEIKKGAEEIPRLFA